MKPVISFTILALLFFVQTAFSQQTLLLKQPSVSAQNLAFVYSGDIWEANRDGSNPRRLTSIANGTRQVVKPGLKAG